MAERESRKTHNRVLLRRLGAAGGFVAAPFIYLAAPGGEHATQTNTAKPGVVRLVDYQTPAKEGGLVFSSTLNKNTTTQPTMSSNESNNPLSDAPLYDKVAVMALVEGAGAMVLAGQKRTHEASKLPTRWTAYAGAGLGIAAANVIALSIVTGML